jgi:hypothetical protein
MIHESGIVRSISQGADAQVLALSYLASFFGIVGPRDPFQSRSLLDRDMLLWILNVAAHIVNEVLQIVRASSE